MVVSIYKISRLNNLKKLLISFAITSFVSTLVLFGGVKSHAAQPYDNGAYGNCAYSQGCDEAVAPTIIDVPASKNNPQKGRAFSVNVSAGQVFSGKGYTFIVTPNFSTKQIKNVQFFIDDKLIGTVSKSTNGAYILSWKLPKNNKYNLRVIMNLTDGTKISENLKINVNQKAKKTPAVITPIKNDDFKDSPNNLNFLQDLVNKTPKALAYTMPYIALGLLTVLLVGTIYQTRSQLIYITALLALLEKDKQLTDEKANFIMLSSHYIRTPLTILGGSIDLAISAQNSDVFLLQSKRAVDDLHAKAEQILNDVQQNKDLQSIKTPDIKLEKQRLYRSFTFIGPIILSGLLILLINLIYIYANKINLIVPNILLQIIIFLVLANFLYIFTKRKIQQNQQTDKVKKQLEYEQALDKTRNQFIKNSAEQLSPLIAIVKNNFIQSPSLQANSQINYAINQLESLVARFILVTQLEHGKIETSLSNFNFTDLTNEVIEEFKPVADSKKLKVDKQLKPIKVTQSQVLLKYVIKILYDNAVKFTPEKGKISIRSVKKGTQKVNLVFKNSGQAIEQSKLNSLFKPFSRAKSAEVFNEGGAGLSLYLARLIMRYLDGEVELSSNSANTTTAKIYFSTQIDK